jgi:pyruvate formate lyase activating enzyme
MRGDAWLSKKRPDGTIQCQACLQLCRLKEDETGLCGIRRVEAGVLRLLIYAQAAATHLDPIEKKPFYHFLPGTKSFSVGTVGCNLSCRFCQNAAISQAPKGPHPEIFGAPWPPERIVQNATALGAESISYTYNEPAVFFEYAYDTMTLAKEAGLKNLFVTSGYETRFLLDAASGLLDGMNIDLKAFSDRFYRDICGARLKPVLHTIEAAYRRNIWLEITTLVIPGLNDSDAELQSIAGFIADLSPAIPWHISGFFPTYQMRDRPPTPPETLLRAYQIAQAAGLKYIYVGNLSDPAHSCTYCPACQRVVITRSGHLGDRVSSRLKGDRCPECGEKIAGVFR